MGASGSEWFLYIPAENELICRLGKRYKEKHLVNNGRKSNLKNRDCKIRRN
jgi:hypothetical protein